MRSTSKFVIVVIAFAVGGLLTGLVFRDTVKAESASNPAPTTTTVPAPTTTAPPVLTNEPAPVQPSVESTGGSRVAQSSASQSSGKPSSGKPSSGNPTGGGQAPSAPAPVITSFNTPENIDCHNGNFQMFTASWSTKNAVKVSISIDGAGVYKTYGPNGEASLPFNCSSPHTFQLKAYNQAGQSVTRSVTLQPRNVQPPETDEEEEE